VTYCLTEFFTVRLRSKLKLQEGYKNYQFNDFAPAANQVRVILLNIDSETPEKISDYYIKERWTQIRNAAIQAFPNLDKQKINVLSGKLKQVQKLRNRYVHDEKQIINTPIPWHEKCKDLELMRNVVLGLNKNKSVIIDIIEIFT
jgi:hypothetical protein